MHTWLVEARLSIVINLPDDQHPGEYLDELLRRLTIENDTIEVATALDITASRFEQEED